MTLPTTELTRATRRELRNMLKDGTVIQAGTNDAGEPLYALSTHAWGECCSFHTACGRDITKGKTPIDDDDKVTCRDCRAVVVTE